MLRTVRGPNGHFSVGRSLVFFGVKLVLTVFAFTRLASCESDPYYDYDYVTSDEDAAKCSRETYNRTCCEKNEFQCGNGACIPRTKVCDSLSFEPSHEYHMQIRWYMNKADCTDGSDEIGCLAQPCDQSGKKCDQTCVDLLGNKSRCSCYKGYTLKVRQNNLTCIDVNECLIGVHSCSHDCVNLNGTFKCSCKEGFSSDPIGYQGDCLADDKEVVVLYNTYNWIYSYNVETKKAEAVILSGTVDSMDYDPTTDMVYWSDEAHFSRSYLPGAKGGNVTVGHAQLLGVTLYRENIRRDSVAVDWTAENIYWLTTDALNDNYSQIMVSKLDGRYMKTLIEVPRASSLVLDPEYGKMYWASGGDSPQIGGAWMNGMFRWTVVRLPGQDPIALARDHLSNGRLYWVDANNNSIYYVFKDGTRPTKVYTTSDEQAPGAMDVFNDYIYWVSDKTKQLVRISKFGRGKPEVLHDMPNLRYGKSIKVYHKRKLEKEIRSGGLRCNRHCSHLCLHIPRGYSCTCPDGNRLVSLMGEVVCDNKQEQPAQEPLDCNCNDTESICNRSSVYRHCYCKKPCHDLADDFEKYEESELSKSQFSLVKYLIVFSLIIVVIFCFVLSFFNRHEVR